MSFEIGQWPRARRGRHELNQGPGAGRGYWAVLHVTRKARTNLHLIVHCPRCQYGTEVGLK